MPTTTEAAPAAPAQTDSPILKSIEGLSKQVNEVVNLKNDVEDIKKQLAHQAEIKVEPAIYSSLKAFKGPDACRKAYAMGQYVLAMWNANTPQQYHTQTTAKAYDWCQKNLGTIQKAGQQLEGTNTLGGELVPEQLSNDIIRLVEEYGVFRPNCQVFPMTSDTARIPRRTGGVTGAFMSEVGALPSSQMTWDGVRLTAKKYGVIVRQSSEVMEDAIANIGDLIAQEIAYRFALNEDQCGFVGDGTSTYAGIVGLINALAAGSIYTAASGHTGFETLTLVDCHGCMGTLPKYALNNAKWYVSAYGFAAFMQRLMYAGGGNTVTTISGGSGFAFLGYPVVISQTLNSTAGADASAQKAWFGNLPMACTMGVRRGLQIQTSDQIYWTTDEIAIRGISRFDINFHERGTASVAGPMVALKTPGS